MGRVRGFTLIELLIVVAIIAILAAIAVPNFLEAQTRAKVSAAKAGLRTLATGLESYAVDNNRYPYSENIGETKWLPAGGRPRQLPTALCGGLTSPIAYLTTLPDDPFKHPVNGVPITAPLYYERAGFVVASYGAYVELYDGVTPATSYPVYVPEESVATSRLDGIGADTQVFLESHTPTRWVLYSLGPDMKFGIPGTPAVESRFNLNNRYDPTNGSVSPGNVLRYPGGASYP